LRLDLRVGDQLPVRVKRGSTELSFTLQVADETEVGAPKIQVLKELQLIDLTPAIRGERGIMTRDGAVVSEISPAVAAAWKLQQGDVITSVAVVDIRDADDVRTAFERLAGRGPFWLFFER